MSEDRITIVTKDGEVEDRAQIAVQIERVSTETRTLTLAQIDQSIADLTRQRDEIIAGLARFTALRASVSVAAAAVALKPKPVPVEVEPVEIVDPEK